MTKCPRDPESQNPDDPAMTAASSGGSLLGSPVLKALWLSVLCAAVFLLMLSFGYQVGKDLAERENRRDCVAAGGDECG